MLVGFGEMEQDNGSPHTEAHSAQLFKNVQWELQCMDLLFFWIFFGDLAPAFKVCGCVPLLFVFREMDPAEIGPC